MQATIAVLAGDGIGPEVTAEAVKVLDAVAARFGHAFTYQTGPIGGCAIDATGTPLPAETAAVCEGSDAILFGAVGGPKWDDPKSDVRPEAGLLGLRKRFDLFANLRPVKVVAALAGASPLRADLVKDVDLIVVRELTGGLYFGEPKKRFESDQGRSAVDTLIYGEEEISRVARVGFELARGRRHRLTSVDKANVMVSSRLWREIVNEVKADYPDVEVEHVLVDACAMHLIRRPADFDVIVTENMFGDILSDETSVLAGSMGLLPSASLGAARNRFGGRFGLYEPIHGSAPDIAGQGKANPLAAILSAAMLLRNSLNLEAEAAAIEQAVDATLDAGYRTADIAGPGAAAVSTVEMGDQVVARL